MAAPKIALFADAASPQIGEIAEAVSNRGGEPVVLDARLGGPGATTMAVGTDTAVWHGIDLSDVRAMHIRGTAPRTIPALPPVMNEASYAAYRAEFLREQEFQAATYAFFEHQRAAGKLVVNPLTSAYVDHDSKSQLYAKLTEWGFRAPRSLTTTDPALAAGFVDAVGEAVVKPMIGVGSTRVVCAEDRERLDEIVTCPTLFQERAMGETIRIHIVGDTVVLALRIISDGGVDSRTETKDFEFIALARDEQNAIVRANRKLGLHYAAWDAILGTDGRLTYLDCNPGPFVMWIGRERRMAVFEELAGYLVTFAHGGSIEEASAQVTAWRPA